MNDNLKRGFASDGPGMRCNNAELEPAAFGAWPATVKAVAPPPLRPLATECAGKCID